VAVLWHITQTQTKTNSNITTTRNTSDKRHAAYRLEVGQRQMAVAVNSETTSISQWRFEAFALSVKAGWMGHESRVVSLESDLDLDFEDEAQVGVGVGSCKLGA
jgi:hypothetical protein